MTGLRLIVGLGNPGAQYQLTRHNVGFWFVDALAMDVGERFAFQSKLHGEGLRVHLADTPLWLLKPSTWMNRSGIAVAAMLRYYKLEPEQCLVVHDDLDLPPGTVRLKFDGGSGGQNGLRDILKHLGHGRFHRLRIGIGHPGQRDQVTDWVLGRPRTSDADAITAGIVRARHVLDLIVTGQFDKAMQKLHTNQAD